MDVVFTAMKVHKNDGRLQEKGSTALRLLGVTSENGEIMRQDPARNSVSGEHAHAARAFAGLCAARAFEDQGGASAFKDQSAEQEPILSRMCTGCGKTAEQAGVKKLLACSACTVAPRYCSPECQCACCKLHKAECKANKKVLT